MEEINKSDSKEVLKEIFVYIQEKGMNNLRDPEKRYQDYLIAGNEAVDKDYTTCKELFKELTSKVFYNLDKNELVLNKMKSGKFVLSHGGFEYESNKLHTLKILYILLFEIFYIALPLDSQDEEHKYNYTEELQGIFIGLVNLNVIIRKGENNGK